MMSARRVALSVGLCSGLLIICGPLPAAAPVPKAEEEGPTADQFYLRVDDLINNVADLDVRRITLLGPREKTFKLYIGDAGVETKGGVRVAGEKAGVARLEVIVMLRLNYPNPGKLVRFMKYDRDEGSCGETEFDAPGLKRLAGVVSLTARPGRYPIGKPLEVGTVHGKKVVVTVE